MSVDNLYSVVGSPKPYDGNGSRAKRPILQLRLRNANVAHVQAACSRISTFKIEAHRLNTERSGLFVNVMSTEMVMTSDDIEGFLEEFKANLTAIVNASKKLTEQRLNNEGLVPTTAATRGSKRYPQRIPLQRSHH